MRDRHDEACGHTVCGGVAEEERQSPARQGDELIEISSHHVRDAVEGRELEGGMLGKSLRDEIRLQLAGENELVAEGDLVHQLHREKKHEDEKTDQKIEAAHRVMSHEEVPEAGQE